MGKTVNPDVIDAALDSIAESDFMTVCEGEPTSYAQATTAKGSGGLALSVVAVTPGDGNGDFTIANDAAGGRKVTVSSKAMQSTVAGDGDHVALVKATGNVLKYVTTSPSQSLGIGTDFTLASWEADIEGPT